MRLTDKKVEEVVRLAVGDDVLPLVRKMKSKDNISEFKLAEHLNEDIKKVRNMLYRLYGCNLVEFTRKKDKKKGWYIYYWTFKPEQIKFAYCKIKKEQLEKLKESDEKIEEEHYFICPSQCVRMDFEQAVNFEYKCPECGELTVQYRAEKQNVKKKVQELEKEIKELD